MLTYKQLLRIVPYKRSVFNSRKHAVHTSITKAEIIKRGKKEGVKFHATGRASTDKVYYSVELEMYPMPIHSSNGIDRFRNVDENTPCWVFCTCPFFKFHSAWVLSTNYGSSELKDCDDKPPKITNPGMKPYVCKHLHALMPSALRALKAAGK